MLLVTTTRALRDALAPWRAAGDSIVLVPTMGHLHDGHMRLVERARLAGRRVVATVFVNPLQFGAGEDFAKYRRTLDDDTVRLRAAGADLLFAPADNEIYPRGHDRITQVEVPGLSAILCGEFRPGHFRGVATVVAKLFNLVQPESAVFGEKDYQQLVVIRRLVEDLNFPVRILAVPTVRDADGLALSSRNSYLSSEERRHAPLLYRTLIGTRDALISGHNDFPALEQAARNRLEQGGFRPDYVAIRRADDLQLPGADDKELTVLGAAWLGATRLIDNVMVNRAGDLARK